MSLGLKQRKHYSQRRPSLKNRGKKAVNPRLHPILNSILELMHSCKEDPSIASPLNNEALEHITRNNVIKPGLNH